MTHPGHTVIGQMAGKEPVIFKNEIPVMFGGLRDGDIIQTQDGPKVVRVQGGKQTTQKLEVQP